MFLPDSLSNICLEMLDSSADICPIPPCLSAQIEKTGIVLVVFAFERGHSTTTLLSQADHFNM